ncbi:hypothetical protein V8G61_11105 [Gaetbulibacter sp. M240]|uniref:hypothetical protein n=1 Tax=Gaetbulibacter sp. M240 TaxID=3126511 RepID=UPI00374E4E51
MNQYLKHNNQLQKVYSELGKEIDITQKEATKVLHIHHDKFRLHMNEGTLDSEDYLKSEMAWDNIDQKLKTLKHIKLILQKYRNGSGVDDESEALDEELLNHSNIATQKELHFIAEMFTDYRTRLAIENSDVDELIKLKIKSKTNSQFIKEKFIKACENLDASVFEPLIDEDEFFEDLDKYKFLQSMKEQFDHLKGNGIEKVKMVVGKCEMCFIGEQVHEFYSVPGNGQPAFAYNIQERDGIIKDIFRCNLSDRYSKASRDSRDPNITYLNY